MPDPIRTYDLSGSVFLVIGGIRVTGGEGDNFVEAEWVSDIGEHAVGADGSVVFNRNNDRRMLVTVTLSEKNKSYGQLAALLQAQEAADEVSGLAFLLRDDLNGDELKDANAVFLNRPSLGKAKAAGSRVFRILLPRATAKYGANLTT